MTASESNFLSSSPHISVLVHEILDFFKGKQLKVYVDGTLGAAGHAAYILEQHPEIEHFIGIDQDDFALEIAGERLKKFGDKVKVCKGNFEDLGTILEQLNLSKVDGMLFDLGVSSMQLDRAEKGFSFSKEGPLDMRMNPEAPLTAEEIVNTWSEHEIGRIVRDYGEEKQWRAVAKTIVKARESTTISSTKQLVDILKPLFNWKYKKGGKGINPLTLVFQGLRIAVNRELEVLESMLPQGLHYLAKGGVLCVITFHSLEDRIVKNFFRHEASDKQDTSGIGGVFLDKDPTLKILHRKPITASQEELEANPRSRSAKLRAVEKI